MLGLGHEVFHTDGATFVRDRDLPDIWEANHVTGIAAASPDEIDRLLDRVEREYAGFGHRRFDLDFTTPPTFEARLLLEGYGGRDFLVMALAGEVRTGAIADIRECAGLDAWTAFERLARENWRESARRRGVPVDEGVGAGLAHSHRCRSPPARGWLAWADGAPRGYLFSWEGVDGVGQVEDLFVHPSARGRGLAAALIRHGVAQCRAAGAGPVVIVAEAADTPKQAYARMGFRPVAVVREYVRQVPAR
jgi:GNAT superfamily N-acetyltransferase